MVVLPALGDPLSRMTWPVLRAIGAVPPGDAVVMAGKGTPLSHDSVCDEAGVVIEQEHFVPEGPGRAPVPARIQMIKDVVVLEAGAKGKRVFALRAFRMGEFIFDRRCLSGSSATPSAWACAGRSHQ